MLALDGVRPPEDRGGLARAVGFARPYLAALGYSLSLFTVGWTTWRGRAAIVDICSRFGYRYDRHEPERLPEVAIEEMIEELGSVTLRALDSVDGNVTDRELVVLSGLVRASNAESIFEFGTFDGRTTLNLAANSPAGARVWSLDLPRESIGELAVPIHAHEQRYADKAESGARYRGKPEEAKITQLYGNSASYDFTEHFGKIDFVFVDASHAYPYVINDSLLALKLLKPGGGIIAWHDYGRWDGVTRALNDLKAHKAECATAVKVKGTTLAVLRTGSSQ